MRSENQPVAGTRAAAATRHSEQLIRAGLCRQVEKQAATPALHTDTCRSPTPERSLLFPTSAPRLPFFYYPFSRSVNIRSDPLRGQVLLSFLAPRFLHLIFNIYFPFSPLFSSLFLI